MTRAKKAVFLPIIFLVFLMVFLFKVRGKMADFEVNYKAGERILWGETLYRYEDGHYMFKYFPSSALIYIPLSYLSLNAAKAVWYALVVFCSVFLFILSYRLTDFPKKMAAALVLLPPLVLAKYFFREIELGQINAVVTVILLLMVWFITSENGRSSPKRKFFAGCLLGIASALKPYAIIFFPYFIVKKKWRVLLGGFVVVFFAFLAPSIYYGFDGNLTVHREWYSTLSHSTPALLATPDNTSLVGFFMKWAGDQTLSLILAGTAAGLLGLLVLFLIFRGGKLTRPEVLECGVLLICIPLVSPLGWDYTLLMSALGVTILVNNFSHFPKGWQILLLLNAIIIAFFSYDILGRELYGTFMRLSITTLNFLLVIGYLSYLRVKKIC